MSGKSPFYIIDITAVLLFLLLLPLPVWGQDKVYTVETVPNVHVLDKTRYLSNPDGIISRVAADSVDRMLYALEEQTGIQVAVVVLSSIGDEDCFDFTHRLFERWGVGQRKTDNGLVMLIVKDQRCIQMETGYGLEGDLPDAIAKRIQLNEMIPYLSKNNWDAGVVAGVKAVCARLDGRMERTEDEGEATVLTLILAFFFLGIAILILVASMKSRQQRRCPVCKKYALQRENSVVVSRRNGIKTEKVTYVCRNCGNRLTRTEKSDDRSGISRGAGPVIGGGIGGGLGRGWGGGSFGGGSFGGGRTGGGGAGSRF